MTTRGGGCLMLVGVVSLALSACSTSGSPLGGPHGGKSKFKLGPSDGGYLNVDATWTMPVPPFMPGQAPGKPGSWLHIYYAYFVENAVGNCTAAGCHQTEMADPTKAYNWLVDEGYIGVSPPPLAQDGSSCLSWYGGDMPPGLAPAAPDSLKSELMTWAAAGGRNDN